MRFWRMKMHSVPSAAAIDTSPGALSERVRIILKDTTHPGNIGATARAMKTMGLHRLTLAAPKTLIDGNSRALAAGALDILANATICEELSPAVAECSHVFALSARTRDFSPTAVSVRQAAIIAVKAAAAGGEVAFVFGGERSGLDNDDMRRSDYAVLIPGADKYYSLNLSQAVQITAYEWRQALFADCEPSPTSRRLPTHEQIERLLTHCDEFLSDIGMPKRGDGGLLRARLRRLLMRSQPDETETRLLRGILTAARKHLR